MGCNTALVDKGYVVDRVGTGTKIEGTTFFTEADTDEGDWFRMRLEPPVGGETKDDARERRTRSASRSLVARRTKSGELVAIKAKTKVFVRSKQLGEGLWMVTGDPTPIRKKRRVIGWECDFVRVES